MIAILEAKMRYHTRTAIVRSLLYIYPADSFSAIVGPEKTTIWGNSISGMEERRMFPLWQASAKAIYCDREQSWQRGEVAS